MGAFMRRPHSAERPEPLPIDIEVEYLNRRALLEHVHIGAEACRLFCPAEIAALPSVVVRVLVHFVGESEHFQVQGRVLSHHDAMLPSIARGLLIEVREAQLPAFCRLLAHASRRPEEWGRRAFERVEVNLDASFEVDGAHASGGLRDLSASGAFIETHGPRPAPGAMVHLRIAWGWFRHAELSGRVVWAGHRGAKTGFGVQFSGPSQQSHQWLHHMLERSPHLVRINV